MTTTATPIYSAGDSAQLFADLLPGMIEPRPEGVPADAKLRIIVLDKVLTIGWQTGRTVGRVDIPLEPGAVSGVTYSGGAVKSSASPTGSFTLWKTGGCACGQNKLQGWNAWEGVRLGQVLNAPEPIYGVPPTRYYRR